MQKTPEFATKRRVGCVMWLAILALVVSVCSFAADISQELAWDDQVQQAAANRARVLPSGGSSQVVVQEPQTEGPSPPTETPVPLATSMSGVAPPPTETPVPTIAPLPTETPVPTIAPLPGIGVDVMVGDVRWNFVLAQNLGNELKSNNEFIDVKTTPGKFIKVTFDMENRSAKMLTYGGINLIDSQERAFTEYSGAYSFIPENEACSFIVNLNPNVPKRCTLIFEVAADAVGLKANVGDLEMFGSEEAYIDLGL